MTDSPLRVLLVDDQQLVRSGFKLMLSVEDDIDVVGEAGDGAQAVTEAGRLRPDVVLMDVQMPVLDGIEATRRIVADGTGRVLILTTFDRDDYLFDGLTAGASGFLLKNAEPELLVDAVRAVGRGHGLLAPEVTGRVIGRMSTRPTGAPHGNGTSRDPDPGALSTGAPGPGGTSSPAGLAGLERLTDRERDVLALLARGRANAEIAKDLYLGEATVKTHVSNVLAKLQLRDRVQAVVFAYESGVVHPATDPATPPRG